MTINILAVGDVVGQGGIAFLKEHLKAYQKMINQYEDSYRTKHVPENESWF